MQFANNDSQRWLGNKEQPQYEVYMGDSLNYKNVYREARL